MFLISTKSNSRIVRGSGVYDLLVTAPFATPWSFALVLENMSAINQWMGGNPFPPFEPFHVLFACLLGSIVVVWSLLRIQEPSQKLGQFDGVARFLFSAWMIWALTVTGAPLLWLFLIPELAWGVIQWWPVHRSYNGLD